MDPVPLPGTPSENLTSPSPALPKRNKQLLLLSLLLAASTLVIGVVIGFMAGTQWIAPSPSNPTPDDPLTLESPDPDAVACTMDAMLCPDGSSVGRVGPDCNFAPCPSSPGSTDQSWERKQYMIEDRVVWDILQPPGTYAAESGLSEGLLLLGSEYSSAMLSTTFEYPKLLRQNDTFISTFDEFLDEEQQNMSNTHTGIKVVELNHPSLEMKLLLGEKPLPGSLFPGSSSVASIVIWYRTDAGGKQLNPSRVRIIPVNSEIELEKLEEFATKLALGIRP